MAVSSQFITVTSTVSAKEIVCPGEEVSFACMTENQQLSPGQVPHTGDQTGFSIENMVNEIHGDSTDSNTVAAIVKIPSKMEHWYNHKCIYFKSSCHLFL